MESVQERRIGQQAIPLEAVALLDDPALRAPVDRQNSCTRRDLPIPASPETSTAWPNPSATRAAT